MNVGELLDDLTLYSDDAPLSVCVEGTNSKWRVTVIDDEERYEGCACLYLEADHE